MNMMIRNLRVTGRLIAVVPLLLGPYEALAQSPQPGAAAAAPPVIVNLADLPDTARQQIEGLMADKQARTPAQRKIGSQLLYKMKTPLAAPQGKAAAPALVPLVPERADGKVDIEVRGKVSKQLIERIEAAGGKIIYGRLGGAGLRALVALDAVEGLAQLNEVVSIQPALLARTQRQIVTGAKAPAIRAALQAAVDQLQPAASAAVAAAQVGAGSVTSEGVVAHRADIALTRFGATGAGVKIGVLSDSDDFLEQSIATGDLPADTTTLTGQSGRPGSGEGTAMLEIIHDVAPRAKLFFATAFAGPESFADNIRALRAAGCDIIVDDVLYYFESPYQNDIIAKAVEEVVADGAQYFSSAGNGGNLNDGTSGVWEGDFRKSKVPLTTLPAGYEVHDFGSGVISNNITGFGGPLILHWSDPGSLDNPRSSNDYDLFVLDGSLRNVLVAATDIQDGTGLPFEFLGFFIPPGNRVVVARHTGAQDRAVRVQLFDGTLALATDGATYGHNSVTGAYGVAAVDVALAGGGAFTGGPTTPVETYSSDGYRRVFYDSNGVAIKPGKFLFKNDGGELRRKPDVAAADGVSTTLPSTSGLNPFFGTSAAAPHAAAIAGLLLSAKPSATPARIRSALTRTALDIEALGRDRDSGFGIVDAAAAAEAIGAKPAPYLDLGTVTATPTTGNGDAFVDPGERANVSVNLLNIGGAATSNLTGLIATTSSGVSIVNGFSTWPAIAAGASAANATPFSFNLASTASCGTAPAFTLTSRYTNGPASPQTFSFRVQTGRPDTVPTKTAYAGPTVPIPDGDAAGVAIPFAVSSTAGAISKLVFSIDGSACSTAIGDPAVGLDHTWVGDLVIRLTSPDGTTVTLASRPGGTSNSGNNFCQTVFDDAATASIQNIVAADAPFTGTFKPASPLAAFIGRDPNGTWVLNVSDNAFLDSGNVNAFSITTTGFRCN